MIILLLVFFGITTFLIYFFYSNILPGEARYAYVVLGVVVYGILILSSFFRR